MGGHQWYKIQHNQFYHRRVFQELELELNNYFISDFYDAESTLSWFGGEGEQWEGETDNMQENRECYSEGPQQNGQEHWQKSYQV